MPKQNQRLYPKWTKYYSHAQGPRHLWIGEWLTLKEDFENQTDVPCGSPDCHGSQDLHETRMTSADDEFMKKFVGLAQGLVPNSDNFPKIGTVVTVNGVKFGSGQLLLTK